jgi:hypothetical protein
LLCQPFAAHFRFLSTNFSLSSSDPLAAQHLFVLRLRPTGTMIAIEVSAQPSAPNHVATTFAAPNKHGLKPMKKPQNHERTDFCSTKQTQLQTIS